LLVGEAFADANQLKPGDTVAMLLNGRRQVFRVAVSSSRRSTFSSPAPAPRCRIIAPTAFSGCRTKRSPRRSTSMARSTP
jgi:hypothetical protein